MSTEAAKRIWGGVISGLFLVFLGGPVLAQSPGPSPFNPTVIAGPILTVNYEVTNHRRPTLTGNVNSASAGIYVVVDKRTYQGVNNGDGSWAASVENPLPDGIYNVTAVAIASDGSQVATSVPKSLVIDTVLPRITVDNVPSAGALLSGLVDDPTAAVIVRVGDNSYSAKVNQNDTWSLAADSLVPALAPGSYPATVVAGDMAGNVSSPVTVKLVIAPSRSNPASPQAPGHQNPPPENPSAPSGGSNSATGNSAASVI